METKFRVRSEAVQTASSQRNKQIVQIVLFFILAFVGVVWLMMKLPMALLTSDLMDVGLPLIVTIGGIFMGVMSIILTVLHTKKVNRLEKSYLTLEAEAVCGNSFETEESDPVPVSLKYSEIKEIQHHGETPLNIEIRTDRSVYHFFEIDNASTAVSMIKERI